MAGQSEIEHYDAERKREAREVEDMPHREEAEIYEIFEDYAVEKHELKPLVDALKRNPVAWVDFMMKFELCLEKPDVNRSYISAFTIGFSYFMGGLVPLMPYLFILDAMKALYVSCFVTLLTLLIFGYVKCVFMGESKKILGAFKTMLIGGIAAASAFSIAKLIPQETGAVL